jgi:hypothetical protein
MYKAGQSVVFSAAVWLISAILLLTHFNTQAQLGASSLNGPGIAFNAEYLPASRYIRPEDSVKTQSTTTIKRYTLGAAFNLYTKADTATHRFRSWTLGISGSYMEFTNKKYEKEIMPKRLLGTQVALQHLRNISPKWSIMIMASAGLFTDMEEITSKDLFLNGGVLFIKQQNPHFAYGFGAVLTNSFGTPMVLPGFLVQWNTGKKFNVEIAIPEKLKVSYKPASYWETAIALRMNGGIYDVEKSKDGRRLLGYREALAGWENSFSLTKNISFNVAAGATLLRSVDYRKKSLSELFKTMPEHKLATNWYASAGIRVQFPQ